MANKSSFILNFAKNKKYFLFTHFFVTSILALPTLRSMPQPATKKQLTKIHFLALFWAITLGLWGLKGLFPEMTRIAVYTFCKESPKSPLQKHPILRHSEQVDSLFRNPRRPLRLLDARGMPIRNRVTSVPSFADAFPDLNDVQLATATRIGVASCSDRDEAAHRVKELVYVGDSPYFEVKKLSHSIPYLVPRAATLLDEIGRSFLDSLSSKGIPFHKLIVTSVLRTEEDITRLRRRNVNASEQSCHRFGTTFDISYNHYIRVQDPDLPPQVETWAVTLKSVLAEVLRDQRELGTCYVKYEVKQACFHITAR